jgi:hypothetical protein
MLVIGVVLAGLFGCSEKTNPPAKPLDKPIMMPPPGGPSASPTGGAGRGTKQPQPEQALPP